MFKRAVIERQPLPFPAPVVGWKQAERVSGSVVITDQKQEH